MKMKNDAGIENVNNKQTNGMVIGIWLLAVMIISDQIEAAE